MRLVLATAGVPPSIVTAPPLMRIFPAASREILIELPRLSPNTDSTPAPGLKLEVIAIFDPSLEKRPQEASRRLQVYCRPISPTNAVAEPYGRRIARSR